MTRSPDLFFFLFVLSILNNEDPFCSSYCSYWKLEDVQTNVVYCLLTFQEERIMGASYKEHSRKAVLSPSLLLLSEVSDNYPCSVAIQSDFKIPLSWPFVYLFTKTYIIELMYRSRHRNFTSLCGLLIILNYCALVK